jgi:sulfur carrier protein
MVAVEDERASGANNGGVKATINGELRDVPDGTTVAELLEMLGAPSSGIAVARNERVVRKSEYATHALCEGDTIEIIKAVAGG